jgi:heme exporter protein C
MVTKLRRGLLVLAVVLLGIGSWLGLVWAPIDREMGDVYRIIYVHVPLMKLALLALTVNFVCCVTYLFRNSWKTDALAEATASVGLLFGSVGVLLGSIWGRPTWGVYWTWDPRLTTAAIMLIAYGGYVALRRFVEDPERRAVWSAVVGIICAVDVPIIYLSVRWWRSLHQIQSSPSTVDANMVFVLRWNFVALFLIMVAFTWERYRIALTTRKQEISEPSGAVVTEGRAYSP